MLVFQHNNWAPLSVALFKASDLPRYCPLLSSMEALTSIVSPPIPASSAISRRVHYRISASLLPPRNCVPATISSSSIAGRRRRRRRLCASAAEGGEWDDDDDGEVERAMGMDESIPRSSEELVRRVSSRAYDMRRLVKQTIDSISYDVLETNPWREDSKPVYVLTQRDNQLWTMKTRRSHSEVETELGQLFSKGGKRVLGIGNKNQHTSGGTEFSMLVEDIREGILVFEDEHDASKYCDLLQGGGQGCEGIAELEASSVFNICDSIMALAVLFRRGRVPPSPQSLEQNLRARKRSLED